MPKIHVVAMIKVYCLKTPKVAYHGTLPLKPCVEIVCVAILQNPLLVPTLSLCFLGVPADTLISLKNTSTGFKNAFTFGPFKYVWPDTIWTRLHFLQPYFLSTIHFFFSLYPANQSGLRLSKVSSQSSYSRTFWFL